MKIISLFVLGSVGFAAASLGAGFLLGGPDMLAQGGAAFALTFIPAVATLAWALSTYRSAPDMQLLAGLGGSGVRMAIAVGGGFVLAFSLPLLFGTPFWAWLVFFYLGLLAFEITLIVRQRPTFNPSQQVQPSPPIVKEPDDIRGIRPRTRK